MKLTHEHYFPQLDPLFWFTFWVAAWRQLAMTPRLSEEQEETELTMEGVTKQIDEESVGVGDMQEIELPET